MCARRNAGRELSSVVDPTRTTFTSPQPIFTLEATAGDTTGTAAIGWQFGDLTFDAKVSGPINEASGEAQFAAVHTGEQPHRPLSSLSAGGATVCTEAVLGAPVRRHGNQVFAELRKFFGPVAMSPRFTRDFTKDVTGVELPVYFLQNTDGGFTGGVRVGWRSDKRGMTVVGFVGQVLGLLTVP